MTYPAKIHIACITPPNPNTHQNTRYFKTDPRSSSGRKPEQDQETVAPFGTRSVQTDLAFQLDSEYQQIYRGYSAHIRSCYLPERSKAG